MARHPQRPCSAANGRLRVGHISGKGRAVFAASAICKDELIAVWGGVILPMEEAFALPTSEKTQCIQVAEGFVLWTGPHQQTEADWINHSCTPNAGLSGQILVVAMRDIRAGEEVCFDYAMSSTCDMDDFDCACGSPDCRGHVGPDDWRLTSLRRRYHGYFSSFVARRIAADEAARRELEPAAPWRGTLERCSRLLDTRRPADGG